jgi:hypothetical protein
MYIIHRERKEGRRLKGGGEGRRGKAGRQM